MVMETIINIVNFPRVSFIIYCTLYSIRGVLPILYSSILPILYSILSGGQKIILDIEIIIILILIILDYRIGLF